MPGHHCMCVRAYRFCVLVPDGTVYSMSLSLSVRLFFSTVCDFQNVGLCNNRAVFVLGCVFVGFHGSSRRLGGNPATAWCWTLSSWCRCSLPSIMPCKCLTTVGILETRISSNHCTDEATTQRGQFFLKVNLIIEMLFFLKIQYVMYLCLKNGILRILTYTHTHKLVYVAFIAFNC